MSSPGRIASVDIVRGLVMGLMAIDHVREYFYLHHQVADPVDLQSTGLPLAFTRFASHICAPTFVLLAGLATALRRGRRGDGASATASYLVRRGLFLMLLEITVINFAWTFQLLPSVIYLQVIWVIGLSMVALAGLIFLPPTALLATSLLIIFGHNLLDGFSPRVGMAGNIAWSVLHQRARFTLWDGFAFRVSYPVLPYVGVIGLGYSMGQLYLGQWTPQARRRWLLTAGTACILLFLILRPLNVYGEQSLFVVGGSIQATLASLLNTTKYPPSLLFLLMTLGPALILLALAELFRGRVAAVLARFGAAPMIFYVMHLYLLHLANLLVATIHGPSGLLHYDQNNMYNFEHISSVWITTAVFLAVVVPMTIFLSTILRSTNGLNRRPTPRGLP